MTGLRFPLRAKFFLFAVLLSVGPLILVAQNISRLTRDELKSAANEDLTSVAAELRTSFDNTFQGRWLTPLMVIRNGVDSPDLDVAQKVSLLTLGLQELPQVAALQLSVAGSDLPILVANAKYSDRLQAAGLDPVEVLSTPADLITSISETGQFGRPVIRYMPEIETWMATLALPLNTRIAGREVTMAAKIDLDLLAQMVASHPFAQRGEIAIVDHAGRLVLTDRPRVVSDRRIVASAIPLIVAGARADALQPYVRPDGKAVLGAYAFPSHFPWAVITELSEDSAYAVVNAMTLQIAKVGLVGLVLAAMGAFFMAQGLTRPILKIGDVAQKVGQGDFAIRVRGVSSRDEIGQLAREVNQMIAHLAERLELMKFVSHSTMSAIRKAEDSGMRRGGERRRVSVIFTDIRGYTSFSETVPPETVVEVLNRYFDVQAGLVDKYGGDVDKFIGDALVAVFEGQGKEERAVSASVEIIADLQNLLRIYPDYDLHVGIGVASGEVVMGATGARDRMDFTVLGSTVNLSARLCSKAAPDQVLIDEASRSAASGSERFHFEALPAVSLKGYAEPVPVFAAVLRAPVQA